VDLSQWKDEDNLQIRFWVQSDGGGNDDGWFIDDVSLADEPPTALALPFFDGFEGGLTNWLHAQWELDAEAYAGAQAAHDTPRSHLYSTAWVGLWLDRTLDLSGTTDPQLVFQFKGHTGYRGNFSVQISNNGGLSWTGLPVGEGYSWSSESWVRRQTSLADYRDPDVRLRFLTSASSGYVPDIDILLDNVVIEELPPPIQIATATPALKSVDLQWTVSGLGADFQR